MKDEKENNQFNREPGNFGLPEGYFQKSANSIFNKIEWQEEHKEFKNLIELKNENVFSVPENYFSANEKNLELIDYSFLRANQNKNPFKVPANYFEAGVVLELTKVLSDVPDELSGFEKLNSLKKQNAFTVSENYFGENENRLIQITQPKKEAKVISLFSKRIGLSAAALLTVVLGLWIYSIYDVPVAAEDCGTIACLDRQDLVKSKSLERLEDDELYELVDPKILEKKLEKTELKNNNSKSDTSLDDMSEEDILDNI